MSEHDHPHDEDDRQDEEPERDPEVEARRQLALAQIRQYGDSALRLRAHEVAEVDDDVRRLIERMTALMQDALGVGLAATQIGVLRRVVVFSPDEEGPRAIVNPELTERSEELEWGDEACLSLQGVQVPVERAVRVVLEGVDEHGRPVRHELEGYAARIVQHELDHLDGVLIIDRTDAEHRKEALAVLRPRAVLA